MSASACAPAAEGSRARHLADACARTGVAAAAFGLLTPQGRKAAEWHAIPARGALRVPALCVTKLLTALLVSLLAEHRGIDLESPAAAVLERAGGGAGGGLADLLEGVSVAQLLAHCHGLGADLPGATPFTSHGLIDADAVAGVLRGRERLFPPGRYFSYGALGYVCLGILVEALCSRPFARVLRDEVLSHLTCAAPARGAPLPDGVPLCPANGEELSLSLDEWLEFARAFVSPPGPLPGLTPVAARRLLRPRVAMPGWSPHVRAGCLGWRDFGAGWYGHNGIGEDTLCYLRLNPALEVAVCLLARDGACGRRKESRMQLLPALLLGDDFPELLALPGAPPAIRGWEGVAAGSAADPSGRYRGSSGHIDLAWRGTACWLTLTEERGGAPAAVHETALYPADGELYYLARPWRTMAFVQTVRSEAGERFLWDHERLWRRKESGGRDGADR